MSTIIRATDRNLDVSGAVFQFDDMAARAQAYLEKVRQQAARILDEARRQAEMIRRQAAEEGRRQGRQEIEQMVHQQLGTQLETLLPALRQTIAELQRAKHAWLAHWERAALRVAMAIAERLLRRQAAQQPEVAVDLLREALELASGSANLRIFLNPKDLEALRPGIETLASQLAPAADTQFLPDPEITPGGCRVETQFGVIDQTWETQLKRIWEELT